MNQRINEIIGTKIRPIELAEFLRRILLIKRVERTINNMNFYLDPVSNFGIRLMKDGIYERNTSVAIKDHLKEGDTFIDVGGNEGYFSILASKIIGPKGRIIIMEPQERLGSVILHNLKINNITNAMLLPFAAGDKEDSNDIIISPSINSGSTTLVKSSRNKRWKRERVYVQKIDNVLVSNAIDRVDLMKMDIEGFEVFAIDGMENALKSGMIKNLIIEFHPKQIKSLGSSIEELENKLTKYGYTKSSDYSDFYSLK